MNLPRTYQARAYSRAAVDEDPRLYTYHVLHHIPNQWKPPAHTIDHKLKFLSVDTLDALRLCQELGYHPVGMNMASQFRPGGSFNTGGRMAQEESLFYRTTLDASLGQASAHYPLHSKVIYIPHVQVFLDSDFANLKNKQRYEVALIAVAAIKNPKLHNGMLTQADYMTTRRRLRLMLYAALYNGHDAIVLGAWGTGAYHNPIYDMACAFQDELYGPDGLGKCFRLVAFAVLDHGDGARQQFQHLIVNR